MKTTLSCFLIFCLTLTANGPVPAEGPAPPLAVPRNLVSRETTGNILLDISGRLLNAAIGGDTGDTDETRDVNDVIYGMPVKGKSRTLAKVSAQQMPNADNAVVDVFLRGQTISDTISVPPEQALLIYSTTTTPFIARKRIYVNEAGLNGYPAQASAQTSIELKRITDLKGRTDSFRTDMAELRYQVKKPFYEHSTNQKTEALLIKKLENSIQPLIVQGNSDLTNGLNQIKAQGVPLQEFHCSTTETLVSVNARIALPGQTTPVNPPLPPPGPFDVAIRAHQSVLNDTFQAMLAGKTFSLDELEGLPRKTTGGFQSQLGRQFVGMMSEENVLKAVSITFADKEPIVADFADHGVSVTINVKEFRITSPFLGGEGKVKEAGLRLPGLKVHAIYRFENASGRTEAVRQGSVQVLPFYNQKIGTKVLGAVLQSSLNQVFKQRLQVPNLPVPAALSRIGTLAPNGADAGQGWVVLTWVRQPVREFASSHRP